MHESEKLKGSHSVTSDSSRLHGLQPTRLLHPWDFPGKNTGVGCHRLLRTWKLVWSKQDKYYGSHSSLRPIEIRICMALNRYSPDSKSQGTDLIWLSKTCSVSLSLHICFVSSPQWTRHLDFSAHPQPPSWAIFQSSNQQKWTFLF